MALRCQPVGLTPNGRGGGRSGRGRRGWRINAQRRHVAVRGSHNIAAAGLAARRANTGGVAILQRGMFTITSAGDMPATGGDLQHRHHSQQTKYSTHGILTFRKVFGGSIR